MTERTRLHVGRAWNGHLVEDVCPCPQAPCGLALPLETCPEHGLDAGKTFRQMHTEDECQSARRAQQQEAFDALRQLELELGIEE